MASRRRVRRGGVPRSHAHPSALRFHACPVPFATLHPASPSPLRSFVAGVCGPKVQRLGMDEIFVDVTDLVQRDLRSSSGGGGGCANGDGDRITGHLYSPGSGGRLLEAQTGLEISLDDDGGGGGGRRGTADRGEAGGDTYVDENNACTPPMMRAISSVGDDSWRDASQPESETDAAVSVAAAATAATCPGPEGRLAPGGGLDTSGGSPGRQRCRCGCYERLAATSAFAARVRSDLLKVVSIPQQHGNTRSPASCGCCVGAAGVGVAGA